MAILAFNKQTFTSVLVAALMVMNLLFIFLQIYKQSQFVKISYGWQRLEKEQQQLNKKRNDLIHQLHLQQDSKNVKKYAIKKLGLRNTNVTQIHKIAP